MMTIAEWAPERRRPTFSFYVTAHRCKRNPQMVETAVDLADAVTVAGPEGPEVIRRLRESGLRAPVLFDGMGYAGKDLRAPDDWVGVQRGVGAARRLLPGALLAWDRSDDSEFIVTVQEQDRIAAGLAATMLLAIDVRWVARRTDLVVEALRSADQPAALVLIHRGDPLSERGAVQGLRRVVQRVSGVSLLRSDHGAIGALAFGAVHASVGLTTSIRLGALVEVALVGQLRHPPSVHARNTRFGGTCRNQDLRAGPATKRHDPDAPLACHALDERRNRLLILLDQYEPESGASEDRQEMRHVRHSLGARVWPLG